MLGQYPMAVKLNPRCSDRLEAYPTLLSFL